MAIACGMAGSLGAGGRRLLLRDAVDVAAAEHDLLGLDADNAVGALAPGLVVDPLERAHGELVVRAGLQVILLRCGIQARERVRDLKRGIFPRTKTYAFGKFFDRFLVDDRFFRVVAEKCTRCGVCAENCPARSILRNGDGTVAWRHDGSCTGCLRCLHNCPSEAIEFGWFTKGKRRLHGCKGK